MSNGKVQNRLLSLTWIFHVPRSSVLKLLCAEPCLEPRASALTPCVFPQRSLHRLCPSSALCCLFSVFYFHTGGFPFLLSITSPHFEDFPLFLFLAVSPCSPLLFIFFLSILCVSFVSATNHDHAVGGYKAQK